MSHGTDPCLQSEPVELLLVDITVQPGLTQGWSHSLPPWGYLLLASAALLGRFLKSL